MPFCRKDTPSQDRFCWGLPFCPESSHLTYDTSLLNGGPASWVSPSNLSCSCSQIHIPQSPARGSSDADRAPCHLARRAKPSIVIPDGHWSPQTPHDHHLGLPCLPWSPPASVTHATFKVPLALHLKPGTAATPQAQPRPLLQNLSLRAPIPQVQDARPPFPIASWHQGELPAGRATTLALPHAAVS